MAFAFPDERWLPKSILCLRDYNLNKFGHDVIAGITVGLVALPLAMAFSIASGLTPQAGIYCAMVTGFLISALGGSKTQIGGPTGAFVVVVAGIVAAHGVDGLFMCTVMAGILLVVMGATGMGTGVKFIPRPVVIGFTNGIAVLIASTQVKDFFGLHLEKVPGVFWLRMKALAASFPTWSPTATILAVATVATMLVCRILSKRIPGPIVAMLGATATAFVLKLPVETIGTRFGGIPSGLPHLVVHWRDCSHRHQHSLRRAVAGSGNDSLPDALMCAAVCCAAGQLHPNGRTGGHPDDCRLQHGRVARDSTVASAHQD